jgi:hypothetical protein
MKHNISRKRIRKHKHNRRKTKKGGESIYLNNNVSETAAVNHLDIAVIYPNNVSEKIVVNDLEMVIIYPNNVKEIVSGFFKNNNHDAEFHFPFYIQVNSDILSKSIKIMDENQNVRKINLFFYVKPNIYFSVRKVIFNSGVLATYTNVIFYSLLTDVILIDEETNALKINENTYTERKNSILLNNGTYEPLTKGPVFNILEHWRNMEIIKLNLKMKIVEKSFDVGLKLCTIS